MANYNESFKQLTELFQDCGQDLRNNITPKLADYVGNTEFNQKICELKFYVQQFTIIINMISLSLGHFYVKVAKWQADHVYDNCELLQIKF